MPKVLVTGASGFIGQHLVRALLDRGEQVTCLVRSTTQRRMLDDLPVQFAKGDVGDAASLVAALGGQEVVFHLAGLTKALAPQKLLAVNAAGTEHLLQAAARQTTPPVVVLVSSLAAAGPSAPGRPRQPRELPCPISHYGVSKLAGELAATAFAATVPLTIVRPPIVFGEGDMLSLELFHPVVAFGIHTVPGLVERNYSLIHADDLARLLILAARQGRRVAATEHAIDWRARSAANGEGAAMLGEGEFPAAAGQGIYYAADDQQPSFAELGRLIARSAGRRGCLVLRTPDFVVRGLGWGGEMLGKLLGKPLSLNRDKAREATAGHWTCSAATAHADLDFTPAAPLLDRLRQTVDWYKEQGWI